MHQKFTKHGKFCDQNNQLHTKNHDELKDNSITFTPRPKSLEGSSKEKEEKGRLGFCNINSTLVNTLEAIWNAPTAQDCLGKK
jgi:hypothetical protein